jgi:hypothetical protein
MFRPTPEHAILRLVLRIGHVDGNVASAVSSVLAFVGTSDNPAVACALGTLLLRRVALLSGRQANAAEVAALLLQQAKKRFATAVHHTGLLMLTGEAEELIAKARAAALGALRPLLAQRDWNRPHIAAVVAAAPCLVDMNPAQYAASVECLPADADVRADAISISWRDPLSRRPIAVPVRGKRCTHVQPFDLDSFLQAAERTSRVVEQLPSSAGVPSTEVVHRCPVCAQHVKIEDLYVDKYLRDAVVGKYFTASAGSMRPVALSLMVDTGVLHVTAVDDLRPDTTGDDSKRKAAAGGVGGASGAAAVVGSGNKSPPPPLPVTTPSRKRVRGVEVEGRMLCFEEED